MESGQKTTEQILDLIDRNPRVTCQFGQSKEGRGERLTTSGFGHIRPIFCRPATQMDIPSLAAKLKLQRGKSRKDVSSGFLFSSRGRFVLL